MRRPRELRSRILIGVALVSGGAMIIAGLLSLYLLRADLVARVDERLLDGATWVRDVIASRPGAVIDEQALQGSVNPDATALFYDGSGALRYRAPGASALEDVDEIGDIAIAALGPTADRQVAGPTGVDLGDGPVSRVGQRYRAVILQLAPGDLAVVDPTGGGAIDRVVIALPLEDDEATIRSLVLIELLAGGLALLLLIVVVDRLLRRLLRPLDTMAETATAVAHGETDRRVTLKDPAAEIERLATALNTAFDRRQEAEGRLSRFVADASHELRTPLTKIRGWAALSVAGGVKPEDTAEVMATIDAEASRMSAMMDELLALARLDESSQLEVAWTDVGALVRDVVDDARVLHADHPIDLEIDPSGGPAQLGAEVNAPRLSEAVRNLVANAGRHTPAGTRITVSVRRATGINPLRERTPAIAIAVHDDGPGIPVEQQRFVFERFYRGSDARATGRTGSGLGLAIVQAIAEAHAGSVELESVPDQGTTITISVPVQHATEVRERQA
jgi:two-component system OmpR family sensor kinase